MCVYIIRESTVCRSYYLDFAISLFIFMSLFVLMEIRLFFCLGNSLYMIVASLSQLKTKNMFNNAFLKIFYEKVFKKNVFQPWQIIYGNNCHSYTTSDNSHAFNFLSMGRLQNVKLCVPFVKQQKAELCLNGCHSLIKLKSTHASKRLSCQLICWFLKKCKSVRYLSSTLSWNIAFMCCCWWHKNLQQLTKPVEKLCQHFQLWVIISLFH